MKTLIQTIIQKRNPDFRFDQEVTSGLLISLAWESFKSYSRGLKLILRFRKPVHLFLGRKVKFFNLKKIELGTWVKLGDYMYVSALGRKGISIGNSTSIGAFSRLVVSTSFNNIGSHIRIGNNVGIGEYAYLGGAGGLDIGDECIVGQYLSCHPENHNYEDLNTPIRHQGVTRKGIRIGNNCWIGSKVTVLDGVTIGDNCVIAAGAVITKDMPSNSVIGGVPARVLKSRLKISNKEDAA